jgi:hypothetical protein
MIPFDPTKPFFNPLSQPNLELLDIAISLSLKRLTYMTEEVLIFPSDVDAEIRDLERKFSEALKLLGNHVKENIKGRGMDTVRRLFEIVETCQAPRLTFYNHVEEQNRLKLLTTAVNESIITACTSAQFLVSEEEEYLKLVEAEQARTAAEIENEYKRLADQEALNLLINMGVHIATIETNKIKENQAAAEDIVVFNQNQLEEDIEMPDQGQDDEASDRGKAPIVDKTPPASPKIEKGSPSSPIPSAVQDALANMKEEIAEEIRDEIDVLRIELRSDLKADISASEAATHRRMDAMMETLLRAIADIKKP